MANKINTKPNNEKFAVNDVLLNHEELMLHATVVAKNHILSKRRKKYNFLFTRLHENYKFILSVYKGLNDYGKNQISLCPASEWLLDNFYIIEEQYKDLKLNISGEYFKELDIIDKGPLKGYPRIFALVLEMISHTDGRIEKNQFIDYIDSYQSIKLLSMAEIWALSSMIKLSIIEKIRYVCEKIQSTQVEWEKVDNLKKLNPEEIIAISTDNINQMKTLNSSYIEHLLNTLKKEDFNYEDILNCLNNRLTELDTDIEKVINLEHKEQAGLQITMGNCITSLRLVNSLDWEELFEKISMVEKILESDPANIYQQQDFESRDYYRHRIEVLSKKLGIPETKIARNAIYCAKKALEDGKELKETHIGYYIIGNGRNILLSLLKNPQNSKSLRHSSLNYVLTMIFLTTLLAFLMIEFTYYHSQKPGLLLLLLIGILFWIPSSEIVINLSNKLITKLTDPAFLPKLEFNNGIPEECSTVIIVPTLIPNVKRSLELINQLEITYLANNEKNIYFAIVGDLKDSDKQFNDEDKEIIEASIGRIKELNQKYCDTNKEQKFFLFMRERIFMKNEKRWMGYERKRGAIVEFNNLIKGAKSTSYNVLSGDTTALGSVKYVITLDADTIMPIGTAKKLIGTICHPINRAVYDKKRNIIIDGYGLIQPRIGLNIISANKSIFSRVFAGQGGIDSYTNAISDVYQDLFGEGIFTGKGIYDIDAFRSILNTSIPDNTVLSHDLLEGSYLRTGLVTDIELIDSYPEKYNSYMMRLHRWVRGDWQLIRWLFPTVKDINNKRVKNPLSLLSRWKIFDNLRRSLVSSSLMLIFVISILFTKENMLLWIGFALIVIFLPLITSFFEYAKLKNYTGARQRISGNLIYGIKGVLYETLLMFIFLPYNSYMMLNAIGKTLYRVFISKRNLLEWVTAADVERNIKNDLRSYIKRMLPSLAILYCLFALSLFINNTNFVLPFLMLIIWSCSPFIAYNISKVDMPAPIVIDNETNNLLRRIARETWFFYETFAGKEDNYLPPDNFQITPIKRIAHRTSPTNIGLLMISMLAAKDLGYLSTPSMINKLRETLDTIDKLEKWNGHLYNWYDTKSLRVLRPKYISTVDNGNFIGYLIALKEGLMATCTTPIISSMLCEGLKDSLTLDNENRCLQAQLINDFINSNTFTIKNFYSLLNDLIQSYNNKINPNPACIKEIQTLQREIEEYFPFACLNELEAALISGSDLKHFSEALIESTDKNPSIQNLICCYSDFNKKLEALIFERKNMKGDNSSLASLALKLETSLKKVLELKEDVDSVIEKISCIINTTSFRELYDSKMGLFSIGYNIEENKLTNSYYDLLASESRTTSYIAVARREVPVSHWFKLGRSLSLIDGYKGLVSWTGTMFEYFMPPLIMKVYDNTLLDETYKTVLRAQIKYGNGRNVPWGTSESGFYTFDLMLNYQYKAFGVPELGLKRGLINDMVVSPYSTILGLPFNPKVCEQNIKSLISHGLEGEFGLYEAIDFTPERLKKDQDKAIVESFMAHHQGMIIIALNNYFNDNIMVKRFHSDPVIKAGEFLLQERIPLRVLITKEHKEIIAPLEKIEYSVPTAVRRFRNTDSYLPECHILSNNNYALLINSRGSGYSKKDDIYITRWREDITSRSQGFFIFLKDINTNYFWSSTFDPLTVVPDKYEAKFSPDKAEFFRTDGSIETHTEICISPEDNCEIRRITITNNDQSPKTIECTSYFETVLTTLMSDIVHPAFSNLFIRTELIKESNSILASRRPREEAGRSFYAFHTLTSMGECSGDLEYESDRYKFIGRDNDLTKAISFDHPLSGTVGAVLDPIMSLRQRIRIEPGKSKTISFIIGVSDTRESTIELSKKYNECSNIERAFELAYIRSQMSSKYLNLKNSEMECFDNMISNIIYLSPIRRKYGDLIKQNKKGQSGLWSHGISGDVPVVLVSIKDCDDIDIIKNMVKAHEYWRTKGLRVDLIILNEDESSYFQPLQNLIREIVLTSSARDVFDVQGGIFIKNAQLISEEDRILFYSAARLIIKAELGNIKAQIRCNNDMPNIPIKKFLGEVAPIPTGNYTEEPLNLMFFNDFGGFKVEDYEYIIRLRSGMNTPAPWVNIIANEVFGSMITESGSGYTWSQNSRENKLSQWTNDPISDTPSEIMYLRNDDNGHVWTITPLPIRENENYTITHGMGYTSFHHFSNGIEQNLTVFVPIEKECIKVSKVKLINRTMNAQTLSIFYYVKPVLGVSDQLTQQHIITEHIEDSNILLVKNPYNSDFSNRITFVDTSLKKLSFTADRREFIGTSGSLEFPEALSKESLSGRLGAGLYPCCAIQSTITLKPNQEFEYVLLLGEGESEEEIISLCTKYKDISWCDISLSRVKEYWRNTLGCIQVKTPDPSMDIMMNSWLLYQTLACRLWARSAFYQSGGAYGFRDQLQDVLSFINISPEVAKKQILLHCAHQFVEGDVQHWWHPGAKDGNDKGIRTRFSDDLLWLPFVVSEYIEKTGDTSILEEITNFIEEAPLKESEDERYGIPQKSSETSSVYEHCIRSIEHSLKFGEHGIPLMGSGDWNDGMNTVGNKGKGESVWMGWFLCYILSHFSSICRLRGENELSDRYLSYAKEISEHIEENAWDGQWYRRAYFDDGTPLGSSLNKECKIDSLAQSWAVISGYGKESRIETAMKSLEDYLINRDIGLILLFTPPFDNGDLKPGYIRGYVPGVRENGGQYTHAATWVISAFAKLGYGDKAFELFKLINPIIHTLTHMECARYKVEPYVMAADVYAVPPHSGRGGWTWYTGSSGWMYKIGLEDILGFNKSENVLKLNPCIPKDWDSYSLRYRYLNTNYNITIKNPNHVSTGVATLSVNGIDIPDKQIILMDSGLDNNVEIILG